MPLALGLAGNFYVVLGKVLQSPHHARSCDGEGSQASRALRLPTQRLHDVMAEAIAESEYEETLAPLAVFEWLYNTWATTVADRRPEKFYHREWIAIHANPEFDAFVAWLRGRLDRDGPKLAPERDRSAAVFRSTVELEKAFFDDAYAED